MARINGMDGGVTFAAGNLHKVKQWSINDEVAHSRSIGFNESSKYSEVLTGPGEWNGSITADFDDSASIPATGTRGNATLQVKTGKTYSGEIVVTGIENEVEMSEKPVEVTFSYEGSGNLTRPT